MVDLGQHFLIDRTALHDIIVAAKLTTDDVVLEIGPGEGVLTEALAQRAQQVIAVELDRGLVASLQKKFKGTKNITIVHDDILRWWPTRHFESTYRNFKVVANLPYAITSRVLRMFLEKEPRPSIMIVMVQKEVAQRICAKPGDMSLLSVAVQFYAQPAIVRIVPRTAFDPPPDVDSAILCLRLHKNFLAENVPIGTKSARGEEGGKDEKDEKDEGSEEGGEGEKGEKGEKNEKDERDEEDEGGEKGEALFFRLVKIGFSSRRKQLQHVLATGLHISNEEAKKALTAIGCLPTVRAQELSLAQWRLLLDFFSTNM